MEQQTLRDFEAKCIQEEAPACQSSCPLHVEARDFLAFMAEGKFAKARQQLDRSLPLSCLTAYLCEGTCKKSCRRHEIDDAIDMPMLEQFCVQQTESPRIMPMPATNKKIAMIGAGLSSFIIAFELGKKGHNIQIFHTNEIAFDLLDKKGNALGGYIDTPEDLASYKMAKKLPSPLIEALSILQKLRVEFISCDTIDSPFLKNLLAENDIVYFGLDDNSIKHSELFQNIHTSSLFENKSSGNNLIEILKISELSLVSCHEKVLFGINSFNENTFINSIFDGKKAAASVIRIFQGVSPEQAREKEAPYPTKLYTNLKGLEKKPLTSVANPLLPTKEEAIQEAKRCIQCACLECLKECSFLRAFRHYPKKYLREVYNNLSVVMGLRQANTMINSCTECGLCEKICPQGLNMGTFFEMARKEMVKTHRMPVSAHEFALEDMAFSNTKDMQFIRHEPNKTSSSYIFFTGCQLPAVLPETVIEAYEHIKAELPNSSLENKECGIGLHLACCSMPAAWGGRENYVEYAVKEFMENWENLGKPTYVFACASCSKFYQEHCPTVPQISLWEMLEKMPMPSHGTNLNTKLALHDACSSKTFPKMQESVRAIMTKLNQDYDEPSFNKETPRCCGYGGLASEANPSLADTFIEERAKDSEHPFLVYCAICRERMQKNNKKAVHILELLFPQKYIPLEEALEIKLLNIFERQEKRKSFRNDILAKIWNEEEKMEDSAITLNISDDVQNTLNERRIQRADILAVLKEAEKNGASFYREATGEYLASYCPRQVTYWVQYAKISDTEFTITDAYYHRMIVPGVSGERELPLFEIQCCQSNNQSE